MAGKLTKIIDGVLSLLKPKSTPPIVCVSCHGEGVVRVYLGHGMVLKCTCWCRGDDAPRKVEVTG